MRTISLLFIMLTVTGFAQDEATSVTISKKNILLIPYEYKMYSSDIDQELHKANNMNFAEINAKFRSALDQNIYLALKKVHDPISFYRFDNAEEARKELSYIYSSIGYQYEPMPTPPKETQEKGKNPLKGIVAKIQEKTTKSDEIVEERTPVTDGEVTTGRDTREKYMKTKVINENLLGTLHKSYRSTRFIFINEMDIKKAINNQYYKIADNSYKREIKVHFTILDHTGKVVDSGAAKTYFSTQTNDINKICKQHLPEIASQVVKKLTTIPDSNEPAAQAEVLH